MRRMENDREKNSTFVIMWWRVEKWSDSGGVLSWPTKTQSSYIIEKKIWEK